MGGRGALAAWPAPGQLRVRDSRCHSYPPPCPSRLLPRHQAAQRRVREVEAFAEALRAEVVQKDEALSAAKDSVAAANARVAELQTELDANASVFELRERPAGSGAPRARPQPPLECAPGGCVPPLA